MRKSGEQLTKQQVWQRLEISGTTYVVMKGLAATNTLLQRSEARAGGE